MTPEQQRALAIARARRRRAEAEGSAPAPAQQAQQPAEPPSFGRRALNYIDDVSNAVAQGMTFGLSDEIEAGVMTGGGLWGDYGAKLEDVRGRMAQAKENRPVSSFVGEIAGGVGTGAGLARSGATLAGRMAGRPLAARVAAGAAEGAAYGGAYGFGTGEGGAGERAKSAATSAAIGGAVGGAVPIAGRMMQRGAERSATIAAAPRSGDLKAVAGQAFEDAKWSGVRIAQPAYDDLYQSLAREADDFAFHPALQPRVATVLNEAGQARGAAPSIAYLHNLRKMFQSAAMGSQDAAERNLATRMIDRVDDFIDNLDASKAVAGSQNAAQAANDLKSGIATWRTAKKAETIENAIRLAETQASGFENGLRIQFRRILRNDKLRRGFTKDELNAMMKIVSGGPTENALRILGKLAPERNILGALGGGGAGAYVGGVVGGPAGAAIGAAGALGLGKAGQAGAGALQARNAEYLRALIASGGQGVNLPPVLLNRAGVAAPALGGAAALSPDRIQRNR